MEEMKIVLGQINTTPRDFEGNMKQITDCIEESPDDTDLIVFPEASIPGYLCQDMLYDLDFINQNLNCLSRLVAKSTSCKATIVVGYYDKNTKHTGKPFKNMAAIIKEGKIIAQYQKQLLPFYDVFDEGRYFEAGSDLCVVPIKGENWGIAICEDIWNDKNSDDYYYKNNPIKRYAELGIKNIISINSSPYVRDKPEKRYKTIMNSCEKNEFDIFVYVNQIGGQDELVFDGNSFVISMQDEYVDKAELKIGGYLVELKERLMQTNPDKNTETYHSYFYYDENIMYNLLVLSLKDYIVKNGFKKVVFGSSGGIDSAVVAAIACDAIGADNVYAIMMPSVNSSEGSVKDAKKLHENLGCHELSIPINHQQMLESISNTNEKLDFPEQNPVAIENLQARLRGMIVMHYSNSYNLLPLTTGNKSELSVGYCTLYGDMCGGRAVICDLYKTEVYSIARYINTMKKCIPANIINKEPSAELSPDQKDKDSLPPYSVLDPLLEGYIEHYATTWTEYKAYVEKSKKRKGYTEDADMETVTPEVFANIVKKIDISEFKRRQATPGTKVHEVAFGIGRRLPITKGTRNSKELFKENENA